MGDGRAGGAVAGAGLAELAFCRAAVPGEGLPSRLDPEASPFLVRLYRQTTEHVAATLCADPTTDAVHPLCSVYRPQTPRHRIAILGDSHSRALLPAFEAVSEALGAEILLGDKPGCPPLLGVYLARGGRESRACQKATQQHVAEIEAAEGTIDTVVLIARWSLYASGDYDGPDPKFRLSEVEGRRFISDTEWRAAFEAGLRRILKRLAGAGARVVVVSQIPQQKVSARILVESAMLMGLDDEAARARFRSSFVARSESDRLQARAREITERLAAEFGARVVTLDGAFVEGDRYAWVKGNDSLYMDYDHASEIGARRLSPLFLEALRR